ncbi:MAG: hypothetical protein ACRD33_10720 [Candidatus Acidiferrales bacterium]
MIAPLAIPFLLAFILTADLSFTRYWRGVLVSGLVSLPQAYLCELVLGIPAWLVFRRHGIRDWSAFAAGGVILGAAYCMVYYVSAVIAKAIHYDFVEHPFTRDLNPLSFLLAVPAGMVSAILFRAVVFPRQPKDNPPRLAT